MKFEYIAKNPTKSEVSRQVPGAGLEPARYCYQRILSPFHHPRETCFLQNYIELFMRLVLSSPPGMRRYGNLRNKKAPQICEA